MNYGSLWLIVCVEWTIMEFACLTDTRTLEVLHRYVTCQCVAIAQFIRTIEKEMNGY